MKVIEYTMQECTDSRELLETRPPRIIPVLVMALTLLFAAALVWSCSAEVEQTVSATGEMTESGEEPRALLYLPQEQVAKVYPGQQVKIGFDAFPGEYGAGEVLSVFERPDEERLYAVRIALYGALPDGLRQGMTLQARLSCGRESVLRWMIEKMS